MDKKEEFIKTIQSFNIQTDYVLIKPNWVSNQEGEYTEKEILEWLFEAIPQKKIVLESYTPWRGLEYSGPGALEIDLENGQKHWDFYKKQDAEFLGQTGIAELLKQHDAKYINVTNEFWAKKCVDAREVRKSVPGIKWAEFYSYIPKEIWEIKDQSTLISLAKIKMEETIPSIITSLSIKNLFGLIPHPSRHIPFHGTDHQEVPRVISDIFKVYSALFPQSLWINEGILTLVKNYCDDSQYIEKDQGLLFVSTNPIEADSLVCEQMGIDPQTVPYFKLCQNN